MNSRHFLTAVLVVAAAGLVPASPAAAAAPDVQRVRVDSISNSVSPKSAIAECPPGTKVVGTGARAIGGSGQVVIEDIIPSSDLTNVTVTAREDQDGFSGNWSAVAIAFCTTPPPQLERFEFFSGTNSESKTVFGECPGRRVMGVGVQIVDGFGQVTMEALTFAPHVSVLEDGDGSLFQWSVTLYVICGNPSFSMREAHEFTEFTSSNKIQAVHCDSDEQVIATGFSLVQGRGQVFVGDLFVAAATPNELRVSAKEDQDGQSMVWSLHGFARCAGA
jgi:hypothetical protein